MIRRGRLRLLTHPGLHLPARVFAMVWGLAVAAVGTAGQAVAAGNDAVLGWTGLRDTYGVCPWDYYFALPSLGEEISATGPAITVADPASWARWLGHTFGLVATTVTAGALLTVEAGLFVGITALALWLFRVTVSSYWLLVVGQIAQGITSGVVAVTTRGGLLLIAIPLGVFVGVLTVRRGEAGRGATMILTALAVPALAVAVFSDPASQMYGPDGVLAFARRVGFSVAAAATRNGAVGGGFDAQVDALSASILTHVVREPLQLWNFGHVVDRVGGCGAAWSAAVARGGGDTPVRAMAACGDHAAVRYAQHLSGNSAWIGAVMVGCALLLGWFMVAAGWAVAKVSVQAIWTTATLLPALWLGGIPGAAQRRAIDTVWAFFRHGIEVLVYIVYVSVIVMAIDTIIARPLPAQLGGTNPFAHVLITGGVCLAALMLLRHIGSDLGRSAGRGLFGRAAGVAAGIGVSGAVRKGGAWGSAGVRRMRGGGGVSGGPAPWDRIDQQAAAGARAVLGEPRPGFGAVGEGPAGGGGAQTDAPASASSQGAVEVCAVGREAANGVSRVDRSQAQVRAGGPAGRDEGTGEAAPTGQVIGEPAPAGGSAGTVSAITATTSHRENIALPTEPPATGQGWEDITN